MRIKYLISSLLLSQLIFAQSDIGPYVERLNEIKSLEDPVDRDSQLIWQYNYIVEELARYQDERTEAYLDTLKTLVNDSPWDNAPGFYYRAMGRYYDFNNRDGDKALEYYQKAIDAFIPAGGDLKELAFTYVLKGFFLNNSGLPDDCWKVLEEGLPYARKAKSKNSLCLMLDYFGDYYFYPLVEGKRDDQKALEYYSQVHEILPQIRYPRIIADNHACLSGVYARLGEFEKSKFHFEIADSMAKSNNLPYVLMGLYSEVARAYEEKGQYQEANKYYLEAYEFTKNTTNNEFKSRIEESLWRNYKNLGAYQKALEHYETHVNMEEEMANEEVEKKYLEIEAKYDIALKEKEIQELRESTLKNTRNLLLALLAILVGAAILIWNKNKALKKSYSALSEKQDEVEQALYQGETQERQRVASELHDNVNTKLAAARWRMEAIIDEVHGPAKDILEGTIEMMNEAYQDVRHISHNLVPDQLENEGLVASVDNLLRKLNSNGTIKFLLQSDNINESKIKKLIYPIYNIIFELINNVMKHADATQSVISIEMDPNIIRVTINDNGQGFDVEKMRKGYGLRSISTRVSALEGTLHIDSSPNKGTTTKITIPLEKKMVTV